MIRINNEVYDPEIEEAVPRENMLHALKLLLEVLCEAEDDRVFMAINSLCPDIAEVAMDYKDVAYDHIKLLIRKLNYD